ncbi:MAG: hypothetical protein C0471_05645 [Erythrobacter sp.]|nr:hypothetical protein [Erythrobacter sp.]
MASDTRTTDRMTAAQSATGALAQNRSIAEPRRALSLVATRFMLVQPDAAAPADWQIALDQLFGWLGLSVDRIPERAYSGGKLARWAKAGAGAKPCAPVFAPWQAWSPAAFPLGGLPGLPQADWTVSYLVDPGAGLGGAAARGIDLALMSPLPSACTVEDAHSARVPQPHVLRAMLRVARAQGRPRIAIIGHARQRNAIARQLLGADRALTRDQQVIDVLTIEEALRPLMAGAAPWDAVIAMPDVRSTVFTMLAETTGVNGPWPMAWYREGARPHMALITSEMAGEGQRRIALDASALVQALALYCRNAGANHAASRLYDSWARLRDGGVTTIGRASDAPYARQVSDAEAVAMLTKGLAVSKRAVLPWRALGDASAERANRQPQALRLVAAPSPTLSHQ